MRADCEWSPRCQTESPKGDGWQLPAAEGLARFLPRGRAKARVPLKVIETTGRPRDGAASGAMKVPHSNRVPAATKINFNKYITDEKYEIAEPHASGRRNACARGGVKRTETGTLAWGTEVVEDRERPMSEERTKRAPGI